LTGIPASLESHRMPLLDHFHPPLHGPRRWEGFHHAWATTIAQQLNLETLPPGYYAEPEIRLGPTLEIDVATMDLAGAKAPGSPVDTAVWAPPRPRIVAPVDFAQLDSYEVRVYQDLGGAELRAAVELVSPANKDRDGSCRTFAAQCAGYLRHGISVVIVDVVTARAANLHRELFDVLEVKDRRAFWESATGLCAVAYRAVTVRERPRVEAWPEPLTLGQALPVLPLWLALDLCVALPLEASYAATCRSLRISA
jgi:hypothetical protein